MGLASCIAPLYIQELSPTRLRGRMVVLNVVMITAGQVVAYAIGKLSCSPCIAFANHGAGAAFESMDGGWRWMVGLGAIPAAIQTGLLSFLPESREYNTVIPSSCSVI